MVAGLAFTESVEPGARGAAWSVPRVAVIWTVTLTTAGSETVIAFPLAAENVRTVSSPNVWVPGTLFTGGATTVTRTVFWVSRGPPGPELPRSFTVMVTPAGPE